MASRRHRNTNRQGGAQGEDGHAELEQLLAAEAHPGSWARRLPGDVDRRGRVIGVRSSHPISAPWLRIFDFGLTRTERRSCPILLWDSPGGSPRADIGG